MGPIRIIYLFSHHIDQTAVAASRKTTQLIWSTQTEHTSFAAPKTQTRLHEHEHNTQEHHWISVSQSKSWTVQFQKTNIPLQAASRVYGFYERFSITRPASNSVTRVNNSTRLDSSHHFWWLGLYSSQVEKNGDSNRVTFFTENLDSIPVTINDSRLESQSFLKNLWASEEQTQFVCTKRNEGFLLQWWWTLAKNFYFDCLGVLYYILRIKCPNLYTGRPETLFSLRGHQGTIHWHQSGTASKIFDSESAPASAECTPTQLRIRNILKFSTLTPA